MYYGVRKYPGDAIATVKSREMDDLDDHEAEDLGLSLQGPRL